MGHVEYTILSGCQMGVLDIFWERLLLVSYMVRVRMASLALLIVLLLFLLALDVVFIPLPFLAIIIVFISLMLIPGLLIMTLVGSQSISMLEKVVLAFSLSFGLWSVPASIVLWLQFNLTIMVWIVLLLILALTLMVWVRLQRENEVNKAYSLSIATEAMRQRQKSQFNWLHTLYWGAFFVVVLSTLFAVYGMAIPFSGDRLTYQAFLRHFLDAEQFFDKGFRMSEDFIVKSARELTQPWLLLLALIVRFAQVNLLDAYIYYIPLLLVLLSFLAFYLLAKELFNNQLMALTTCIIQALYYFSDIGLDDSAGFGFFLRIIEDKFLLRFILLPVALWLTLRYLRSNTRENLAYLLITLIGVGLIHPIGIVLYSISAALFMLIVLLFQSWTERKETVIKFIPVGMVVLALLIIPLWQRQEISSNTASADSYEVTSEKAFDLSVGLDTASGPLRARRLFIISEEANQYIAAPYLIAHPLVFLAILLTPLLWKYIRTHLSAQFLFSNMVGVLVLCYTPFVTPLLGKFITPWVIWRVLWLLPASFVIIFFLHEGVKKFSDFFRVNSYTWVQIIPLCVVLIAAFLLKDRINQGPERIDELKVWSLTADEQAVLTYLHNYGRPNSYIMTPNNRLDSEIPGIVGHSYALTFRNLISPFPNADEDQTDFYELQRITETHLDILRKYNIRYVILNRNTRLANQFNRFSHMFEAIYNNQDYFIYEWQPNLVTEIELDVISGNTYLSQNNDPIMAETAYQRALQKDPNFLPTLTGLARLYLQTERVGEALEIYQRAVILDPDDAYLYIDLADAYVTLANLTSSPSAYRRAIDAYRQSLNLAPENQEIREALVTAYLTLGDLYFEQDLQAEVIAAYQKVVELDPEEIQFYWQLAEVYENLGEMDKATEVYADVVERWPDLAYAHLRLGQAYEAQGNIDAAMNEYEMSIAQNPNLSGGYINLGRIYQVQARQEDAIDLYQTAIRHNASVAWPHLELGKIYLSQIDTQ